MNINKNISETYASGREEWGEDSCKFLVIVGN